MRAAGIAIFTLVTTAASSLAQEFTSPQDLLTSLYEVILFGRAPLTEFEPYFTERLSAAMAGGRLDLSTFRKLGFDPMTGVTNSDLVTVFRLETTQEAEIAAKAVATFNAGATPVRIEFELVWEPNHGWQIDQLQGTAGDVHWTNQAFVEAIGDG